MIEILDQTAIVRLQLGVYGMEPVLRAAHVCTRHCHIHIEETPAGTALCRLRGKRQLENLEELAGNFCNEVLEHTLRARLRAETEPVRRLILAQAFSRTNLITPDLDTAVPERDPARIGAPDDRAIASPQAGQPECQ